MPYCMGTLYWQLNDVWPVSSWSSIEYSGKWKALHYAAKRFYRSVTPLIYVEDGKLHVKVANDSRSAVSDELLVSIVDFSGSVLRTERIALSVPSVAVSEGIVLEMKDLDREGSFVWASFAGAESVLLLCRPKDAEICNPELEIVEIKASDGGFDITLACNKPAFYVTLDAGSVNGRFEDNFFALNGRRTVRFDCPGDVMLASFKKALCVRDLYSSFSDGGCENG